ncbi:MAG: histidine kinase [Bacteroidales bacterium]|nr:histidine kinase [Bacteroidales bacterium]
MISSRKKKAMGVIMHIIAWLVLFSFPFLFSGDEIFRFSFVMQAFWLPLGWSFLLFYINYFILTRLLIQKGNILAFFGINLLLMILFASLSSMISVLLPHPPPFTHGPPPGNGNRTPMREPFQKAKEGIQGLAKLMRYLLYETNEPKVPVSKEINFLREYIQMMQLRTREDVKIEYTFPSDDSGLKIAPLLKLYGKTHSNMEFLWLLHPYSSGDGNRRQTVLMSVENSCYPKPATDRSGSGIGLENLKKRLAQLYPKKHQLALETLNSIYCARLQINLSPNDK